MNNKIQRIESYDIGVNHKFYPILDNLSFKTKNLYNYANYLIRQEFINNHNWIRYNQLANELINQADYKALPSQTSQQTLRLLDKNWVLFFKSIKRWVNHPDKFKGRPKLPNYKDKMGRSIIIFTNQQCKLKEGYIQFPEIFNGLKIKTTVDNLSQVRIIPCGKHYKMEAVYKKDIAELKPDNNQVASIDMGLNNFATITNNIGLQPIVINGKQIKSMNQYYNKVVSQTQPMLKRVFKKNWCNELQRFTDKHNNKMNDYIHKASRFVINYCLDHNLNTLVIGKNEGWKQGINIGKVNNQKFVNIPFATFIDKLRYKCEDIGLNFVATEESYTSKASILDNDELPKDYKENSDYKFSGKRIKRGLYQSKNGTLINADCNGSYNIMRKVFPKALKADRIVGVGLHPVRVNILTENSLC
jgi:putative transposase